MLNKTYCTSTELAPRLGGTFCGDKLVTAFALIKAGVEFNPATFKKATLDQLIKEDKFVGRLPFFNSENNDQEADYHTSVIKERTQTMGGIKGFKFSFNKGASFQNELSKINNSKVWSFIPIFEDGSALFAVKKNGMLTGFECNTFVDIKQVQLTSDPAGSTLQVDITRNGMTYWQSSSAVYESDEFSFNEVEPVTKLIIEAPVLTTRGTTTKVKVREAYSGAIVTGLTTAADWKVEEDGVLKAITNVSYDASTQEYTLTHTALTATKKVRFVTSNNGLRVISVDTNYYTGESEIQTVV